MGALYIEIYFNIFFSNQDERLFEIKKWATSIWFYLERIIFSKVFMIQIFTLSNAKHGESIVISFAVSATSKGPQIKTTEPMVSFKVTNCSIQLGWILAPDGFAKKYMGYLREAKKCDFYKYCNRAWKKWVFLFLFLEISQKRLKLFW